MGPFKAALETAVRYAAAELAAAPAADDQAGVAAFLTLHAGPCGMPPEVIRMHISLVCLTGDRRPS